MVKIVSGSDVPAKVWILEVATGTERVLTAGTFAANVGTPLFLNTGPLTLGGGVLAIDVLGTNGEGNPGGHDLLSTSGPVTISAPTVLLINLGTFHPTPNVDAFRFITDGSGGSPTFNSYFIVGSQNAGVVGTYDSNTNHIGRTFIVGSDAFQIDYGGATGTDLVLLSVPVPEPGSAVMLLGGIGLLAVARRRRRNVSFSI